MESKTKKYIIGIAIPLAVGGLSALLTQSAMQKFNSLNQPPLAPPSWLFPVVWTVLFVLMGIASALVYMADVPQEQKKSAAVLSVWTKLLRYVPYVVASEFFIRLIATAIRSGYTSVGFDGEYPV